MAVFDVQKDNFKVEVLDSDIPVVVDLWAPWCGPCKAIYPAVNDISEQYQGKVKVVKVNIDENPTIAADYKVMSIPTLLIFKGGQVEHQIVGLVSKDKILNKIEPLL